MWGLSRQSIPLYSWGGRGNHQSYGDSEGWLSPSCCLPQEKTEGLVESHHFYVEVCFKIYSTSETNDVLVAGLVHRGEQVEEGITGGVEDHDADFF